MIVFIFIFFFNLPLQQECLNSLGFEWLIHTIEAVDQNWNKDDDSLDE